MQRLPAQKIRKEQRINRYAKSKDQRKTPKRAKIEAQRAKIKKYVKSKDRKTQRSKNINIGPLEPLIFADLFLRSF